MKRILSVVVACLFCSVCLFAGGTQEAKSEETVELVYWSAYDQSPPFVQGFADAANKLFLDMGVTNARFRAEVIPYEGYIAKYLSAFASGKGPDVFEDNAAPWAMDGGVNPVAVAFPDDVDKAWSDNLVPFLVEWGRVKGKRYGFPTEANVQMLYINTDFFKEAGLDPNRAPSTVDEFTFAAQKLTVTDASGEISRSGYAPRYSGHGLGVADKFTAILSIFGGRMLNKDMNRATGYINSPESVAAFQFYYDLVYKYKVVNMKFDRPEPTFQQGLTAMIFREGWFAEDTKQQAPNINFGIAPYISGKTNVAPNSLLPGCSNISKNSKHKELIFELFKQWATTPEADVIYHKPAGYPPVLKQNFSMSNEYFGSLPYAEALLETMEKPAGPSYHFAESQEVSFILGEEIVSCLFGTPAQEAADRTAKRMDEAFAKLRSQ